MHKIRFSSRRVVGDWYPSPTMLIQGTGVQLGLVTLRSLSYNHTIPTTPITGFGITHYLRGKSTSEFVVVFVDTLQNAQFWQALGPTRSSFYFEFTAYGTKTSVGWGYITATKLTPINANEIEIEMDITI